MGIIDDGKLQNILPKYSELKLSGENLAQQYVSAFNTGMNIYQCINQLQGYIGWVIKAVNDVVIQWNEIVDTQIKDAINASITASKQATTEQFNVEWVNLQPTLDTRVENLVDTRWVNLQPTLNTRIENLVDTRLDTRLDSIVKLNKNGTGDDYYILTESKDKNIKKLDYYFKSNLNYLTTTPYYSNNIFISNLDLEGYTVKKSFLRDNTCKLKNKSTGELIDYVYLILDDNVTVTTSKTDNPKLVYSEIAIKYLPYFAKLKTDTPVEGKLYVDACISIILEKTSS